MAKTTGEERKVSKANPISKAEEEIPFREEKFSAELYEFAGIKVALKNGFTAETLIYACSSIASGLCKPEEIYIAYENQFIAKVVDGEASPLTDAQLRRYIDMAVEEARCAKIMTNPVGWLISTLRSWAKTGPTLSRKNKHRLVKGAAAKASCTSSEPF